MKLLDKSAVKPLKTEMRWWLFFDSFLVFSAGIQLFILSEQTDRYFAWTINPPLTAAFLGASYWGGLCLVFLSALEQVWANARPAVPGIWLFTVLTLLATLIHLDRFHMDSIFGWVWLIVYIVVPLLIPWLFIRQQFRLTLPDPPRRFPTPRWLQVTLIIQATVMSGLGVILFIAPQVVASFWPWTLTPLTGRAVAAWLVGIGAVVLNALWEVDLRRIRVFLISYSALGLLQLLALARYLQQVNWSQPQAWLYLLFLFSLLVAGLAAWYTAQQTTTSSKD